MRSPLARSRQMMHKLFEAQIHLPQDGVVAPLRYPLRHELDTAGIRAPPQQAAIAGPHNVAHDGLDVGLGRDARRFQLAAGPPRDDVLDGGVARPRRQLEARLVVVEVRVDRARHDGHDGDAERFQLEPHRLRIGRQCRLGGRVRCCPAGNPDQIISNRGTPLKPEMSRIDATYPSTAC